MVKSHFHVIIATRIFAYSVLKLHSSNESKLDFCEPSLKCLKPSQVKQVIFNRSWIILHSQNFIHEIYEYDEIEQEIEEVFEQISFKRHSDYDANRLTGLFSLWTNYNMMHKTFSKIFNTNFAWKWFLSFILYWTGLFSSWQWRM